MLSFSLRPVLALATLGSLSHRAFAFPTPTEDDASACVPTEFPNGGTDPQPIDQAFLSGFEGQPDTCYLAWRSIQWRYSEGELQNTNDVWIMNSAGDTLGSMLGPNVGSSITSELPWTVEVKRFTSFWNSDQLYFSFMYGDGYYSSYPEPFRTPGYNCQAIDGCASALPGASMQCIRCSFKCS